MVPTNERRNEGGNLDVVRLGEYDGENIYVFYPEDATAEELETMWIRSPENWTTWLTDQQ